MTQPSLDLVDICESRHGGSGNSSAAHDSIIESKAAMRGRILRHLRAIPSTCDEVEVALSMSHQTASARFSEMRRDGFIREVGKRATRTGRMAAVMAVLDAND
jgi:hypothetical protein